MDELVKIKGAWKATVNRADGRVEVHHFDNTISSDLKAAIVDAMQSSSTNFAMDDLFTLTDDEGNALISCTQGDGIALYNGSAWIACDCSESSGTGITQPTATTFKVVGYIATAGTYSNAKMGITGSGTTDFTTDYATATSWSNITLGSGDTLTIEWTISIS